MARAIWKGAISFGLVNVPVRAFTAVSKKDVRFHQLHGKDGARLKQKRVCTLDGEEVAFEEIVKGYEISPDNYVVITPEELDALDPASTRSIDIEDFVDLSQIDPIYFEKPYYLVPETGATKPYRLLLDAMRDKNRVAIARVVFHTKQHLVAIRAMGDLLTMETMLFSDEVVDVDTLGDLPSVAEVTVDDRELTMAGQLIDALTTEWEPQKYHDTHRERVLALIEQKAAGQEIVAAPAKEAPKVVDLMAALEASVAQMSRDKTGVEGGPAADENGSTPAKSKSRSKGSRKQPA